MRTSALLDVRDLVIELTGGPSVVRVIDGLSFTAAPGTMTALLGPSGCGKTTLLSCLAGLQRPTRGVVRLGSLDVGALSGPALTAYRRHDVGLAFQSFNLVSSLDALENVMVPLRAPGMPRRAARVRAAEALRRVGLGDRLHHRPAELSGGQQQRVALARAIAADPQVLLADEPTAHLDRDAVAGVLLELRRLTDEGRATIVATHDDRVLSVVDQVLDLTGHVSGRQLAPS